MCLCVYFPQPVDVNLVCLSSTNDLQVELVLGMEAASPASVRRHLFSRAEPTVLKCFSEDVRSWLSVGDFWKQLWSNVFWPAGHDDDAEVILCTHTHTHSYIHINKCSYVKCYYVSLKGLFRFSH